MRQLSRTVARDHPVKPMEADKLIAAHHLSIDESLASLDSSPTGLSASAAATRLEKPEFPPPLLRLDGAPSVFHRFAISCFSRPSVADGLSRAAGGFIVLAVLEIYKLIRRQSPLQ